MVYSLNENNSVRFSVNRAFQTPNYSEFFLQAPAAAPTAGPATVEGGIEAYYTQVQASLPPAALAGLTLHPSLPWNFSPSTQVLALGNANLDVETVLGWELGYKGSISNTLYFTADFYINKLENFVTDLLPGVNPALPDVPAHRRRDQHSRRPHRPGSADPAAGAGRTAYPGPGGSAAGADSHSAGGLRQCGSRHHHLRRPGAGHAAGR